MQHVRQEALEAFDKGINLAEGVLKIQEGRIADDLPTLIKSGVSGVPSVQVNKYASLAVTRSEMAGVTGVTNSIPGTSARPIFVVFEKWIGHEGVKYQPGVWHFGIKQGKADEPPTPTQTWVCSPLYVEAITYDGQQNNFGRLLRFRNTLNEWREWAMPMDMLRGSGDDLRGELLSMGVEINPSNRTLLATYLQTMHPKRKVRCALQVGWCDDSFVLPDTVIGPNASSVIFQSSQRSHEEHTRAGTLEGWKETIAALAVGNPLLVLALSASFAGPVLARCNGESGGVHFVGDSSTGKTTAIEAACATWGGTNYKRSWRATANGMEGAAALFNDCLLALDEISECDPKEVGSIVYALGNGRGKQRAGRSGNARSVTRWRCFIVSSGERTIATTMAEGGSQAKAGQAVRLLDIPSVRTYGAWDDLHGMQSGTAFSDAIKRAATTHYGHAGRSFLEKLTQDRRNLCSYFERFKLLPEFRAEDGDGQGKRGASRFALLAFAGELATEYGITGWPEGEATKAAAECFRAWQDMRGKGNDERRQILERLSSYIDKYGDSRFSDVEVKQDTLPYRIINERAGYWREVNGCREYLFTPGGMQDALKGFDFKRALDILQQQGVLETGADGRKSQTIRAGGRQFRLYRIVPDKLEVDNGT